MRYFSMFTGVGGFELGIKRANDNTKTRRSGQEKNIFEQGSRNPSSKPDKRQHSFSCIGFSEIDKYASQLLKERFPTIHNYGDCTRIRAESLPSFDLLVGGFPCQSFSIAGKRRGFQDTRGTMFFEIARILRVKRPKLVLLENVKGLLNHDKGKTFSVILQTLEELGYNTQWMVLNSKFFGVPQNRERVFIIGSLRGEPRPEILPFRKSYENINERSESQTTTSTACTARYHKGGAGTHISYAKKHKSQHSRVYNDSGIAPTLAGASKVSGDCTPKIVASRGRNPANPSDRTVGSPTEQRLEENKEGISNNLTRVQKDNMVLENQSIRRLTPLECERLQGFPDNWTEKGSIIKSVRLISNIWEDVRFKDVEEDLLIRSNSYVSNTIKDGENGETQRLPIQKIESIQENVNVRGVIEWHTVEDGVCDITNLGRGMAILYNPKKTSIIEEITRKNLILERMENQNITELLKIVLEENLEKEKLSIILTWIKEIIKSQIFISARTEKPITSAIIVFKKSVQNYSKEGLLDLRMENITYFSDTQRYKMMGNAVTVNVIEAIARKLL